MKKFQSILRIIAIPVIYAVMARLMVGSDIWSDWYSVMSITFIFCVPTVIGAITVYYSSAEKVERFSYRFFMPWVPILIFLAFTLIIAWEGWACWLIVLPVFLLAASIGGLLGAYMKRRKKDNKTYFSILVLLPFMIAPIESFIGAIPGTYIAYTYIDIQSTPDKIWSNVTRVKEIDVEQDKGWLTKALGFPRPLSAELNYEGVGAYREARFTNGLVFHETVVEYVDKKKMVFSIKAYPHEIPSATMDEHVVIGGKYFDVLNGTYELEKLSENNYRLHLYSHFKLATTFNFYASWWAKWIMKDIQYNILQVGKQRSETPGTVLQ
jgi:hypothetical protein